MNLTLTVNTEDCWLWGRSINDRGYGVVSTTSNGKRVLYFGHRLTYEHYKGLIPEGLEIDHLCMVRRCVNPDHLEAVTTRVNMQRAIMAKNGLGKPGYCHRGHELTPDNCYHSISPQTGKQHRQCRKCNLDMARIRHAKRRNNLIQGGNEQP